MLINGIDISTYGAKLLDRNISINRMSSNYSWEFNFDSPSFFGSSLDFKDVLLYVLFKAENEETFLKRLGKLSEQLRYGATVKFKDISMEYKMYLKEKPEYDRLTDKYYKVTFSLDGDFGLSDTKVFQGTEITSLKVKNNGTYTTPIRLEITFPNTHNNVTISGLEHTIYLKNIGANSTIVLDSITGDILYNGEAGIDKFDGFYLPKVKAGEATIRSSVNCNMTVSFKERY